MYNFFNNIFLIIILTAYMSNDSISFNQYIFNNTNHKNILMVNNLNQNNENNLDNNFNNTENNYFDINKYTTDNWEDTSNNAYLAEFYRAKVDKNSVVNIEKLQKYTKKIWVTDFTSDFKLSLKITDIKDNIISGKIKLDEIVPLNSYDNIYDIAGHLDESFIGEIDNEIAKCRFGYNTAYSYDKGKVNLTFIDETTIKLDVNIIYSTKHKELTNKVYYLKPYYRQLKDIPLTNEKYYTVNLDSWGLVNITTGYLLENHSSAVAYITNKDREILYEFDDFINGLEIKNVIINDINNDGLKDVKLLFNVGDSNPIVYNYIQMKNGLFVKIS